MTVQRERGGGLRLLNLALVAALWAGSVLAWPALPDRIPQHVGAEGVTAWRATSVSNWFLLPALATATLLLLELMRRLVRTRPGLLNFPGREQLLALPPERQWPVTRRAMDMMDGTITIMLLIFGAVQVGLWHVAHGGSSHTMLAVVLPLALLSTPLVLGIFLPRITSELERQVKSHRADGGSVPS